jgi:ribosome biogenesis GTPase
MSDYLTGRIIKGVGSFYSVAAEGETYICRPRGKFRIKDETPMVGDLVEFTPPTNTQEGYLLKILPRKNELLRPPVANIDLVFIVIAAANPDPDLVLLDKMLINASMMGTESIICINKYDITGKKKAEEIAKQYKGHKTLVVSAQKGSGINSIVKLIKGKIVCFAGQSGTGKSSLLNEILPERSLEVGEISRKTKRGRHTTRHAELVPFAGGYLVDTPGFSLLELPLMEPNELQRYYSEFEPYEGMCKYKTCRHEKEPGCAVLEALEEDKLSKERHKRYCEILKEAEEKWRTRYD